MIIETDFLFRILYLNNTKSCAFWNIVEVKKQFQFSFLVYILNITRIVIKKFSENRT